MVSLVSSPPLAQQASAGTPAASAEASATDEMQASRDLRVSAVSESFEVTRDVERVAESAALPAIESAPHEAAHSATRAQTVPTPEPQPAASEPVALAPDSNLVMIETRFAAPPIEEDQPASTRPHRVRPARTTTAEEPLQMVETRKEQAAP